MKKITDYVLGKQETTSPGALGNKTLSSIEGTYFEYLMDEGYSKEFVLLCQEIYRVGLYNTDQTPNPPGKSNMIEKDLSELNKSNMFYAYNKIKTRL